MDDTPNLALPYVMAAQAQAQKHIMHNQSIRVLDAIVQLAVLDRDLNAPSLSSRDGERYIVATSATTGMPDYTNASLPSAGTWAAGAPAHVNDEAGGPSPTATSFINGEHACQPIIM